MMTRNTFYMFKEAFPNLAFVSYVSELRRMLRDCRTALDVGCGASSPIRFLKFEYSAGVDGYGASVAEAKSRGTHDEFYLCDVRDIGKTFHERQFDCCVALDVIEHLSREDGLKLIHDMERIASKRVLIFTPNGFMPQQGKDGDLQEHLSGWNVDDMEKLGYRVVGMYGHKFLRGNTHNLRFRPKVIQGVVSELTHYLYTHSRPEKAAAILCVKKLT